VHADFVAVADDSKLVPRNVSLPALNALTAPYPLATRAGPYVFTTPIAGVDVRSGVPLRRIAELPVEEQALADPPYSVLGEEAAVQQVVAFRHIEAVLRAQGSSLAWQVRQNGWMQLPMRDFGPASRMRARLFAGRAAALTSVQVRGIRNPGALFEYGVFAVVPGADDDAPVRELPSHAHGMADYYVGAVRAGAYVLTAGEVPVDVARPGPIRGFGDLEAALRALAASRVDACGPVLAQATYVYAKLADALRSVGADMQDVVHQTVYVTDARDCAAIERVATLYFGADLPATTVVPIVGTSPYAESRLEIELVAYGVDRRPPFTS